MYWIQNLSNGLKRVNHAAVAIGNLIYSFGGYCSDEDLSHVLDVFVFNTDSLSWHKLNYNQTGDIPLNLFGHTAVTYKNKIYIWGGMNGPSETQTSEKFYCFDLTTLQWSSIVETGAIPKSTDGHTACVIDNFMYVFGGYESATECLVNLLYRVDLDTYKWERVWTKGTPPFPRDFHTASVIGRRMYIFGGRSYTDDMNPDEVYYNEMMYFDVDTLTWVTPCVMGEEIRGRRSHSATVYNDEIIIFGGCAPDYQADVLHLNDAYKFNPERNIWTELSIRGCGPNPRRRHCCVVINDHLYLFGGSSPVEGPDAYIPLINAVIPRLKEENDLFIMDLSPTLKRLCQLKVLEYGFLIDNLDLPVKLKDELEDLQKNQAPIQRPQEIIDCF